MALELPEKVFVEEGISYDVKELVNRWFAYRPEAEQYVAAIVQLAVMDTVEMEYYAPDGQLPNELPPVDDPGLLDEFAYLFHNREVEPFQVNVYDGDDRDKLISRGGIFKIDDWRPGCEYSYMISNNQPSAAKQKLVPHTPYRLGSDKEAHKYDPITSSSLLNVLMAHYGIEIRDLKQLEQREYNDPSEKDKWDKIWAKIDESMIVWDLGSIEYNRARHAGSDVSNDETAL